MNNLSVDGPTIGILRYEGQVVVVHILKLPGSNSRGVKISLGPMAIEVDEALLNFTAMEVCHDCLVLEYIPEI